MKIEMIDKVKFFVANQRYNECKQAIASLEDIETYLLANDISEDNTSATITIETTSNFTDEPLHCAIIKVNQDFIQMLKEFYAKEMKKCQKELKEMGVDLENSNIPALFQLLGVNFDD